MLACEKLVWAKKCPLVAGLDEAGRGPLAGPVVAGAVCFDRDFLLQEQDALLAGLTDSKKLTAVRREYFFELITNSPHANAVTGMASVEEIDDLNILRATHCAMARAIDQLLPPPDHILVDGLPVNGLPYPSTAIIKGDSKSLSIAAGSIMAKVVRDKIMCDLHDQYPQYGFAQHKGYGTAMHMQALKRYGPCPVHRMSFSPVRRSIQEKAEVRRQQSEFRFLN